jgi:hypothetical protein
MRPGEGGLALIHKRKPKGFGTNKPGQPSRRSSESLFEDLGEESPVTYGEGLSEYGSGVDVQSTVHSVNRAAQAGRRWPRNENPQERTIIQCQTRPYMRDFGAWSMGVGLQGLQDPEHLRGQFQT